MKKINYRICPICNNNKSTLILPATSSPPKFARQISVTEKYFGLHGDIVKCNSCGFAYVGKKNYTEKVVSLYKEMYDDIYLAEEKERRLSFIRVIHTIEELRLGKKGKIIDIGCCTGGLLVEAKKRGWQIYGIDPSTWAYKVAKRLHRINIYNELIETYNPGQAKFDAVTILDVFEHVQNPKFLLLKVFNLLKDDGICAIVTPDFGSIASRILREKWWGVRLAHLSYFRYENIKNLLTQTGFRMVQSKTYIRYFSLYYILVRIFPIVEKLNLMNKLFRRITVPLILFDTFELYITKRRH